MISILNRYTTLLAEGENSLSVSGAQTPELDAQILLAQVLGVDRMRMIAFPPEEVPPFAPVEYRRLVKRRAEGEPIAYITGRKEFHNYVFKVDRSVLIPRQETEELAEAALKRFSNSTPLSVADVGTGSGCIAITLGLERPSWQITAVDVCEEALVVARQNAAELGAKNTAFFKSDVLSGVEGKFDLIVSNPPYIDPAQSTTLQVEIKNFEPHTALFAGYKGLEIIQKLVAQSEQRLNDGGALFCEIGWDQKNEVAGLFNDAWEDVTFIKDISGRDRIVFATLRKKQGIQWTK
ncbi:MAG: peptide chain release factor N(5)-glutamine methyltransferase [Nitrospinae bacterium]|nr:peptide chain release factor N(5)-glutamine methyltransferase [Nitrospinota bacterium]